MDTRPLRLVALAIALCAAAASTGCMMTPYAAAEEEAARQAEIGMLREQVRRVEGRIEGIELELDRLRGDIDLVRSKPTGPSQGDVEALQSRLAGLESQIRSVDSARQKDRQEIIDSLSGKIASLVGSSRPSRPAAAAPVRRATGPQEGYEHVVEPGQTLSAIAAAYNVSSKSIVDANNLTKPDQLRVGQKLFIPAP